MLFESILVFDSYRQKISYITGVRTDDLETSQLERSYEKAQQELDTLEKLLRTGKRKSFEPLHLKHELTPRFSETEYTEMIDRAKRYIYEGDIFQVVFSNPLTAPATGSLFDAYRVLRSENPSPYMLYFTSDDVEIAGASPETLTRLEDSKLYTFPLAGTRPRGKSPEEDEQLEAGLLKDEKELAEHNMLVDLGRNDLGRVCTLGSVHRESHLEVLKFSRVMHIGSTVAGTIAPQQRRTRCNRCGFTCWHPIRCSQNSCVRNNSRIGRCLPRHLWRSPRIPRFIRKYGYLYSYPPCLQKERSRLCAVWCWNSSRQ